MLPTGLPLNLTLGTHWDETLDPGLKTSIQLSNQDKEEPQKFWPIRAFSVSAQTGTAVAAPAQAVVAEPVWVRTMPMTCYQVWINDDNSFEFIFWWEYANNNWVKIYDMAAMKYLQLICHMEMHTL